MPQAPKPKEKIDEKASTEQTKSQEYKPDWADQIPSEGWLPATGAPVVSHSTAYPSGREIAYVGPPRYQTVLTPDGKFLRMSKAEFDQRIRFNPDYEATYWENPHNVAKAYWKWKAQTPGSEPPAWMDTEAMDAAYRYMDYINGGEHWLNWKWLSPEDPARGYLQSFELPPLDYMLRPEEYVEWAIYDLMQNPPEEWNEELVNRLPADYVEQIRAWHASQKEAEEVYSAEELPGWQKIAGAATSTPWMGGAATLAIPGLVFGGLPGLIGGAALGAGLGALAERVPLATRILEVLNVPWETLEQSVGTVAQIVDDPRVLSDLDAAWQAGRLTAESGTIFDIIGATAEKFMPGWKYSLAIPRLLGIDDKFVSKGITTDFANFMPMLEYSWLWVRDQLGADVSDAMAKIQFTEPGEVFMLGKADPLKVDAYGLAGLHEIRKRILRGEETADQILMDARVKFGFTGDMMELTGAIFLDPLNITGVVMTKGVTALAKATGNYRLLSAMTDVRGPVQGFKKYGTLLQVTKNVDELTWFEKFLSATSDSKRIKWIDPDFGTNTQNWVKKFSNWTTRLTPEAQGHYFVNFARDTMGTVFGRFRDDPDGMVGIVHKIGDAPPSAAAELGDLAGSSAMYTVQRSVAEFTGMADEMLDLYNSEPVAIQRAALQNAARALEISDTELLKLLKNDTDALATFDRMIEKLDTLDTELASALKIEIEAGTFRAEDLKAIGDLFNAKDAPAYNPRVFETQLLSAFDTHAGSWAVQAFGIRPRSRVYRFFGVLKRAQSMLLLGLNPAYFVNNVVNNEVTRMAVGVFGVNKPGLQAKWYERWGAPISRYDYGATIAGIYGETFRGGELEIRKASRGTGFLSDAEDVLRATDKFQVAARASQQMERISSMSATYHATSKTWNNTWPKHFPKITAALREGLEAISPGLADEIESIVKGSLNTQEIKGLLDSKDARYNPDLHVRDVAMDLGIDEAIVRDTLQPIYGYLAEQLATTKTPDDIRNVFTQLEELVQNHFDELVERDIRVRAEDVANRVQTGSFPEAKRIVDDMNLRTEEYIYRHFNDWEEFFQMDMKMRDEGLTGAQRNPYHKAMSNTVNRGWRRLQRFQKATAKGLAEGLGLDNASADRFVKLYDNQGGVWDEFYTLQRKLRDKHFETDFKGDYDAKNAHWQQINDELDAAYASSLSKVEQVQGQMDDLFVTMVERQYGEGAAELARQWREEMLTTSTTRGSMWLDFRREVSSYNYKARRRAYREFLEKEYLPFIRETYGVNNEYTNHLYKVVMGEEPPPPPRPKEPVPETPPEGGAAPAPEAARPEAPAPDEFQRAVEEVLGPSEVLPGKANELYGPRDQLPPDISDAIRLEAETMLGELEAGGRPRLIPAPEPKYTGHQVRAKINPDWYSDLYKSNKINRKTVINSLKRIIEDKGKDVIGRYGRDSTLELVKGTLIERLTTGGADLEVPQNFGILMQLGYEDEAARAFQQWLEDGMLANMTDEDLVAFVGGEENLAKLNEAWGKLLEDEEAMKRISEEPEIMELSPQDQERIREIRRALKEGSLTLMGDTPEEASALFKEYQELGAKFGYIIEEPMDVSLPGQKPMLEGLAKRVVEEVAPTRDLFAWEQNINLELYDTFNDIANGDLVLEAAYKYPYLDDPQKFRSSFIDTEPVPRANPSADPSTEEGFLAFLATRDLERRTAITANDIYTGSGLSETQLNKLYDKHLQKYLSWEKKADLDQLRINTGYKFDADNGVVTNAEARIKALESAGMTVDNLVNEIEGIAPHETTLLEEPGTIPQEVINDIGNPTFEPQPGVPELIHRLIVHDAAYDLAQAHQSLLHDPKLIEVLTETWQNAKKGIFDERQQYRIDLEIKYNAPKTVPEVAPVPEVPAPEIVPEVVPEVAPEIERSVVGPYPPGLVDSQMPIEYAGFTEADLWQDSVRDMLYSLRDRMIERGPDPVIRDGIALPDGIKKKLDQYLNTVYADMTTTKRAVSLWAENLRDQALLNYQSQHNFDDWLKVLFPYQFWYTRSAYNWALRLIDQPNWFANLYRLRRFMESGQEIPGFPSRMKGKIGIPTPYTPEWTGGNVWIDPMRSFFPIEEFTSPLNEYERTIDNITRNAEYILVRWVNEGRISSPDASLALSTKRGKIWEDALAEAKRTDAAEEYNPMTILDTVMSPALYWTLPYFLITGKTMFTGRQDLSLLPSTRTGLALEAVLGSEDKKGILSGLPGATPLAELGAMLGKALAFPEQYWRKKKGLSEFGDWGTYYVDRMLSNMAAEGKYPIQDLLRAQIEKQGPAYEEAMRRVQLELAFRVPGSLPTYAALHGAGIDQILAALVYGWWPAGLYPEGELTQRGLKDEYEMAWKKYNIGDPDAMTAFYDEHPEYETRLALWDEPEERMRQFLISNLWDKWSELGNLEKQQAQEAFGQLFQDGFLDRENRNYDQLDIDTLAYWLKSLGGAVPEAETTQAITDAPDILIDKLEFAPPEEAAEVDAYRRLRGQMFPNWYALSQHYFAFEEDSPERKAFLKQFPELKDYFEWNRAFKDQHPVIEKYKREIVDEPDQEGAYSEIDYSFVQEFTPSLSRQLLAYYYADQPLSEGTMRELRYVWDKYNRPGGTFEVFITDVLRPLIVPDKLSIE